MFQVLKKSLFRCQNWVTKHQQTISLSWSLFLVFFNIIHMAKCHWLCPYLSLFPRSRIRLRKSSRFSLLIFSQQTVNQVCVVGVGVGVDVRRSFYVIFYPTWDMFFLNSLINIFGLINKTHTLLGGWSDGSITHYLAGWRDQGCRWM